MRLADADTFLVKPALALCAEISARPMDTMQARVMMLCIGLQESAFKYRRQVGGPAVSYWQFEQGGGVHGVLTHLASSLHVLHVCQTLDYEPDESTIYNAMADNELLSACMTRLLLWTDPRPLPDTNDIDGSWALYQRVWRPGRPHPEKWQAVHEKVLDYIGV